MRTPSRWTAAAGVLAAVALVSCGSAARQSAPADVQPAAQGAASPPPAAAERADTVPVPRPGANEADVRFMTGMIAHHAQALEMTRLVPERSGRQDVRLLAERITASQQTEIDRMRQWLRDHGQPVPDARHAHHEAGGGHAQMPGMLTPEELARLSAATGAEFDRLFLELMIRHHEGALTMVAELLSRSGAAQDSAVFQIASDVDADQRAEIARMRRMLGGPPPAPRRR